MVVIYDGVHWCWVVGLTLGLLTGWLAIDIVTLLTCCNGG